MSDQETRNDENVESTDSDNEIDYVGLKNQGATCYMNSLLQALFHLPAFRRIVYKMPTTGKEDINKNIPLNLQRLFAMMQFSDLPCSTKALTNSFGWKEDDTFMQHDLQEFSRVLIDNLETKLKSDPELHDSISNLFKGETVQYIRCKNVPYESIRAQDFYDISLQVKDCANLQESFEKYIQKEQLVGENQYHSDEYGLQDADMGTEFTKFPSVLHLHLQRFQFNHETEQMQKINDKFEFPESIDLAPYLAPKADHSRSMIYDLYGVLVHLGNVHSGHYYAFLRTSTKPQWYKFDDNVVSKVNSKDAIEDNFGEKSSNTRSDMYRTNKMGYGNYPYYQYNNYGYNRNYYANFGKKYSAYMLIYIRRDDADRIMAPVKMIDIPTHLQQYAEKEKRIIKRRKEIKQDQKENIFYVILQDKVLENNTLMGIDIYYPPFLTQENLYIFDQHQLRPDAPILLNNEEKDPNNYRFDLLTDLRFKIGYRKTTADIYELVSEKFNIPNENIRIWYQENSQNRLKIVNNEKDEIINDRTVPSRLLFLQRKTKEDPVSMSNDERLIFVKYFFPTASLPIQFINSYVVNVSLKFSDFCKQVNEELGITLEKDDRMLIYRQYNDKGTGMPSEVEIITENLTMKDVPSGVFIFLQIDPTTDKYTDYISRKKTFDPITSDYDEHLRIKYENGDDEVKQKIDELKRKMKEKRDRVYSIRPTTFQLREPIPVQKFVINDESEEIEPSSPKDQIKILKESDLYPRIVTVYPYYIMEKYNKVNIDIYSYEHQDKHLFTVEIFIYSTILKLKYIIASGINENYNQKRNAMIFYIIKDNYFYTEFNTSNKQNTGTQNNNDDENEEKIKLTVFPNNDVSNSKVFDLFRDFDIRLMKRNYRIYFLLMDNVDEKQAMNFEQYTVQISLDGISVPIEQKILEKRLIQVEALFNSLISKIPQLQEIMNKEKEENQNSIDEIFRFYQIYDCKFYKQYKLNDLICDSFKPIRIDFIPIEQRKLKDDEILIQVAYIHPQTDYYNYSYSGDGYPLFIVIKKEETFGEIKKRILEKTDINKNDITGFSMRVKEYNRYVRTDIKDDTVISERYCPESRIYIIHKYKHNDNASIKIYN